MMMDLNAFCLFLQLNETDKIKLEPVWEKLTADWNGKPPFFLEQDYFDRLYPLCQSIFPLEQVRPLAAEIIRIVRENPEAALLAHITYYGSFLLDPEIKFDFLPDPLPFFGQEYSGMFGLMISLGAYPLIVKAYAEAGVPEKYAQAALLSIGGTMIAYSAAHNGKAGRPYQFSWNRLYIEKKLFRIGRLEYRMHPCPSWVPAIYRNQQGDLAVICRDGWRFRPDGRWAGMNDPSGITTHFMETEDSISGIPCFPDGKVDFDHPKTLLRSEWQSVVSPWDLCPSIHIPAGSRMPFEEIKVSLLAARDFFTEYFHRRVPLFVCSSWILNPAWETLLHHSNMAQFRQECFAFPSSSWHPKCGMRFIFGRDDISPLDLPAANSLQDTYQKAFRQDQIENGSLFVLTDDLEKLGNQYYRKNFSMIHA